MAINSDGKTLFFSVVELYQEDCSDKVITDERLFSSRENAIAFLRRQFDAICEERKDWEFSKEFSEDGWYQFVDEDGDLYEGYVSEGMAVDEDFSAPGRPNNGITFPRGAVVARP